MSEASVSFIIPQTDYERTPEAVAVIGCEQKAGVRSPAFSFACILEQTSGAVGTESPLPSWLVRQGITQPTSAINQTCQNAGWLKGVCEHGATRWVRLSCKRRACPVCGELRRKLIAWRISAGIDMLGEGQGAAWFVGTFAYDIAKREAVKVQGKFIRWLRKQFGYQVEYAATWEVTKAGRLHLNLVVAPWWYMPKEVLDAAWQRFGGGPRTWIQRVGVGVGVEAAKAQRGLGGYLGKWEQMVEVGRGVAFSKQWPKLPDREHIERQGKIVWQWVGVLEPEAEIFDGELARGYWWETTPGEYRFVGEKCHCFDVLKRSP